MFIDIIGAGALGGFMLSSLQHEHDVRLFHTGIVPYRGTVSVNGIPKRASLSQETYSIQADLTIYTGYLHQFRPNERSAILLLSNGSCFVKSLSLSSDCYCGVINHLAAHRHPSRRDRIIISVNNVGDRSVELMVDNKILSESLTSSSYESLYDSTGSLIYEKALRTVAYALMATNSIGEHGPELFNRRRNSDSELQSILEQVAVASAHADSFIDNTLSILHSLPSKFYPSVARPTDASRKEAHFLIDLFKSYSSLYPSPLSL